jgi:antitoxin PrlF
LQYYIWEEVRTRPMESAITSKGQTTIPKAVRDHLKLKPGDRVKFFIHPDGSVVLLPKLPASALRGIVQTQRHATIEQMDEAIAEGAVSRFKQLRER